jgi:hypothetical protein
LKTEDLLTLINIGFLREKEMDLWLASIGDPYPMEKNPNEIPMFARFVERGLALPASDFFKRMLRYNGIEYLNLNLALPASDFFKRMLRYNGIEYLNLNPNGIFHVSVFVHFCEAFVGIKPH